jgi:hypothetical protein
MSYRTYDVVEYLVVEKDYPVLVRGSEKRRVSEATETSTVRARAGADILVVNVTWRFF